MTEKTNLKLSKRKLLKLLGGASIASLGAGAYAFGVEPDLLTVTENELQVPYLPPSLNGLRVLHLTDLHFDHELDEQLFVKLIIECNRLEPDIIVLTGDYITDGMLSFDFLIEHLAKLNPKYGIYASIGNHDGWHGDVDIFRSAFEKIGAHFLFDQNSELSIDGDSLWFAGTDSVWSGHPDLEKTFAGIPSEAACLALVHEPDFFDQVALRRKGVVQFSGHTHGGQCRVPLIGYAPVKVKYGEKYLKGKYKGGEESQLFVSSGVGTVGLRVRFACLPEVALLTLRSSS